MVLTSHMVLIFPVYNKTAASSGPMDDTRKQYGDIYVVLLFCFLFVYLFVFKLHYMATIDIQICGMLLVCYVD